MNCSVQTPFCILTTTPRLLACFEPMLHNANLILNAGERNVIEWVTCPKRHFLG